MSNQKFKVGDRVRIVRTSFPLNILRIDIGKIVQIDGTSMPYLVEIQCKNFRPKIWCYEVEHVKPEKHPVIVITTDGKTTTATMRDGKTVLKTATARCGKKDAFDFNEGARIAFERKVGNVYEVKDGLLTDDDGTLRERFRATDIVSLNNAWWDTEDYMAEARFIPLQIGG